MKTTYTLLFALLLVITSCTRKTQVKSDPYAELGDTVPAKEFEPKSQDSLMPDTAKRDSIPVIETEKKSSSPASTPSKPESITKQ